MTDKTNAKTPSKDGGEEMRPQMLESMGWLTESILIPRKGKTIEGCLLGLDKTLRFGVSGVGAGTLVDLKAQFYQGQEQARQEKESGELRKGRKRKNEDDGIFGWTNRGVLERDRKDRLHLKSKEEVEADVAAQLEKKAELYDQLGRVSEPHTNDACENPSFCVAQGEGPVDEDEVYEVDFLEKRFEQHVKKAKQPEETPPNETEWQEDEERKKRREVRVPLLELLP